MYKCLRLIDEYVPRHKRLGACCKSPVITLTQDVVESIPVVRDDGSVVSYERVIKSVPAKEVMSKYKMSAFRLSALIKNGVPLKMVNINSSNVATIDQLYKVCQSIDDAEQFVKNVEAQKQERASWFKDPELDNSSNV